MTAAPGAGVGFGAEAADAWAQNTLVAAEAVAAVGRRGGGCGGGRDGCGRRDGGGGCGG